MSDDEATAMAEQLRAGTGTDIPHYTLLNTRASPVPFKLTWAKQAVYPCRIGVRKDVYALGNLLRFRAKADVLIPSGRFIYGFSAKDTILNGKISLNVPAKILAYQKNLSLPNGMNVSLSAGSQYIGGERGVSFTKRFKPLLGFQLRFGGAGDGNLVFSGDGFSAKNRLPLPLGLLGLDYPKFDLEMYTSVKIPQLTSRYSIHNDGFLGAPQPYGVGSGAARADADMLHVHVQGINAVVRL